MDWFVLFGRAVTALSTAVLDDDSCVPSGSCVWFSGSDSHCIVFCMEPPAPDGPIGSATTFTCTLRIGTHCVSRMVLGIVERRIALPGRMADEVDVRRKRDLGSCDSDCALAAETNQVFREQPAVPLVVIRLAWMVRVPVPWRTSVVSARSARRSILSPSFGEGWASMKLTRVSSVPPPRPPWRAFLLIRQFGRFLIRQ